MVWSRVEMAVRAAEEIPDGAVVNLGIGLPTLIADSLGNRDVWLHSENGLLGMGPFPHKDQVDPQIINAGKQTVTIATGGSTFDSSLSFAMIRGRHLDCAFLGAMQVSCAGDLANWAIPGGRVMGIGGAMDLAAGAARVIALCMHLSKKGQPKLRKDCSFPLTATGVVSLVITDMGVLRCAGDHFEIVECAPKVSRDEIAAATDAPCL